MNGDGVSIVVWLAVIIGLIWLYVLPSIIAFRRRPSHRWAMLAINPLLRQTRRGWGGALIWALNAVHRSEQPGGSRGGESGLNLFVNDVNRVCFVEPARAPREAAPLSPAAAVHKVERLGRLRAEGHISEPEFAALKAAVLGQL